MTGPSGSPWRVGVGSRRRQARRDAKGVEGDRLAPGKPHGSADGRSLGTLRGCGGLTLEKTATEGGRCPRRTPVIGTRDYHIAPFSATRRNPVLGPAAQHPAFQHGPRHVARREYSPPNLAFDHLPSLRIGSRLDSSSSSISPQNPHSIGPRGFPGPSRTAHFQASFDPASAFPHAFGIRPTACPSTLRNSLTPPRPHSLFPCGISRRLRLLFPTKPL